MKPGRVVILLAGRHAGKKAIIVRQHDDGKKVQIIVAYHFYRTRSSLTPS
jgi:ribosomal protein L14E/L6E/L27E